MAVAPRERQQVRQYLRQHGGEEGERLGLLAQEWQALAAQAPNDIAAHAKLLHRTDRGDPITFPRHMQVWAWLYEQIERYRWLCVVAPTGYAKTTFWSQIAPAADIGRRPGVRIGLISNTANQAYENSKAVQQVVLQPLYRAVYGPDVAPSYAHDNGWGWAQEQWYVKGSAGPPHATMRAFGMDGPILGRRLDRIYMDDPTTWEQARSRAKMEAQRRKLHGEIITRFPAGQRPPENRDDMDVRMCVVCTRWGTNDLIRDFEDLGFKIVTMPALGYWDAVKDPVTGDWQWGLAPLWPKVETTEQLLALRLRWGTYFDLVWQGNAKAGTTGTMFDPDNFQRGRCPYQQMGGVTSWVDTSSGKQANRGDYFCIATLGQNKQRDVPGTETWVINVNRDRYNALEQEAQVEQEAVLLTRMGCPPEAIYIATSNEGGASLWQRLVATTRLPLVEGAEREDKEFRATPLAGAYKARYVWHDQAQWNQPYEAELELFPGGDYDDQVDCAAGAYNHMEGEGQANLRVLRSRRGRR
jgi:phage terminase large subunit-like protein